MTILAGSITGDSAELVALELFEKIVEVEDMSFNKNVPTGTAIADRKWILDTYAECLQAVEEPQARDLHEETNPD